MDHNDDDESGDDEICFVAVVVGGGLRVSRSVAMTPKAQKFCFSRKAESSPT